MRRITEGIDDSRLYRDLGNFADMRKPLNQVMESYNASHQKEPLKLVLFDTAPQHLVRLMRVIRNPRGHVLMMGMEGSGKRCIARLAAYTSGYLFFEITLKRAYSEDDFKEDIKQVYRLSCNNPVVFLLDDTLTKNEVFLEHISNMLNIGMIPSLFTKDERNELCNQFRDKFENEGNSNIWECITENCNNNLHVILTMSQLGEKFRLKLRNFPSLISLCVIDWYHPWPEEAFRQVSKNFLLGDQQIKSEKMQLYLQHESIYIIMLQGRWKSDSFLLYIRSL